MNTTEFLRRNWRIPVVGLLAAVLAFTASFVVSPTYESSTRLLVHGRDATFMSSTGEDLTAQPGVVDASLSQALLSTYAGIATSRTVAIAVTDELKLDQQPPSTSVFAPVAMAVAWTYRCGRAFLTAGFCAPVDRHEQAIVEVQEGTSAQPVGTNEGSSAGQPGSYVLEVSASGNSPALAKAVTDAVADQLVTASNQRFKRDSASTVESLQAQVEAATEDLELRTRAVAQFQTDNDISAADARQALSAATLEDVRANLLAARADLADARAQLASIQGSLSRVPRNASEKQTIVTGRSSTEMNTDTTSSVYNELLTKQNTLQAEEAGLLARVRRLQKQLDQAQPLEKNGPIAELSVLQQGADLAAENLKTLTTRLQKAQSTSAQGSVDLSRLDEASEPSYPAKPKRYIYLALGLLIGGLAGLVLTARVQRPSHDPESPALAAEAEPDFGDTRPLPPAPVEASHADELDFDLIFAGGPPDVPRPNGYRSPES